MQSALLGKQIRASWVFLFTFGSVKWKWELKWKLIWFSELYDLTNQNQQITHIHTHIKAHVCACVNTDVKANPHSSAQLETIQQAQAHLLIVLLIASVWFKLHCKRYLKNEAHVQSFSNSYFVVSDWAFVTFVTILSNLCYTTYIFFV